MAKIEHQPKAIVFAKLGRKLKCIKTCEKPLYHHTRVILYKKRLQEVANIWKETGFAKWPKLATCKGYSLCKVVGLGEKMKFTNTCEKPP